jgi:hypothetical protein
MRYLAVAVVVLCLAGTGFSVEIYDAGTKTLTVSSFGTMVDPAGLEEIDASDVIVDMSKADFNALPGLKVIEFSPTVAFQSVTSIVALYDGANSVTFSNFGDPNGYNYGGGTSYGRSAHSGTQTMQHLGTVQGVAAGNLLFPASDNPNLNWFAASITTSAPGTGVSALGFVADGRDTQATDLGKIWLGFSDGSSIGLDYDKFGGIAGSGLLFGYEAPAGKFITRIECTRNPISGNSYIPLDDLAFVVTPEPITLMLLVVGGLAVARRRYA